MNETVPPLPLRLDNVARDNVNVIYYMYQQMHTNIPLPPPLSRCAPTRAVASFLRSLDHTQRRTTVGRTPLDASSTRRTDLFLTTHNTHNRHPRPRWDSKPQSQQASGRRSYALDRAATGTGKYVLEYSIILQMLLHDLALWHHFQGAYCVC